MCHANNERLKTTNDERFRTTKPRKNQNTRRKKNLQILENIGSDYHQICRDERQNKKEYLGRTRKLLETKQHSRNLIKGINTWVSPRKILGTILEVNQRRISMDQRTRKFVTMHKDLHLRYDVYRLYMSGKKKVEEDSPAFRIASMHRYCD